MTDHMDEEADLEAGRKAVRMAIRQLDPDLALPSYARPGDAGLDLFAREYGDLAPGHRLLMPTGIAIAVPEGYVGLVHPRSGLAVSSGLSIVNSPGTIDSGYRGEIFVPLLNTDLNASIEIQRGDRIAQLIIQQVEHVQLVLVDELSDGVRGEGGLGSTGR
ncbi:MAG: dUTP diphosphatase [Euzebya sp.]